MRVTILGTAGGRFAVVNQVRASGGFILEMDGEMFHVDPGPGAIVQANRFGLRIKDLTGVLVSHGHPDHYVDAEIMVEAMTGGALKRRGIIIGNSTVISGNRPVFSQFHLKAAERFLAMEPGQSVESGRVRITAVKTMHKEGVEGGTAIGFVFEGSRKVGYTSDGEYYGGQEEAFKGCDLLIIDVLRPRGVVWPGHMNAEQARTLIERARPKAALLTHFGMRMIGRADEDAGWITRETGVRTIAARDGMAIDDTGRGIRKHMLSPSPGKDLDLIRREEIDAENSIQGARGHPRGP